MCILHFVKSNYSVLWLTQFQYRIMHACKVSKTNQCDRLIRTTLSKVIRTKLVQGHAHLHMVINQYRNRNEYK
jgi:hypothetical protein